MLINSILFQTKGWAYDLARTPVESAKTASRQKNYLIWSGIIPLSYDYSLVCFCGEFQMFSPERLPTLFSALHQLTSMTNSAVLTPHFITTIYRWAYQTHNGVNTDSEGVLQRQNHGGIPRKIDQRKNGSIWNNAHHLSLLINAWVMGGKFFGLYTGFAAGAHLH